MGPVFQRTTTVGGAAISQPLQTAPAWQHRFLAIDSIIEYMLLSTTVNDTYNISLGSSTEVQESNVGGGRGRRDLPKLLRLRENDRRCSWGRAGDHDHVRCSCLGDARGPPHASLTRAGHPRPPGS